MTLVYGCPPGGMFAGMTTAQLQALLAQLQQAYIDLISGKRGESFSYAQGDGAKSVTYTRANAAALVPVIAQVQAALGMCGARRRPIRPLYLP
jgi:hypothetical protein